MDDRERREKRHEASRDFDALLRARVADNKLTPRLRSFMEPEAPAESTASDEDTQD